MVPVDGGAPREVEMDDAHWYDDPQWSADGKSLIVALYPPGLISTRPQEFAIGQFDLQTKKTKSLPGSEGMVGPRLSPNGRYLSTLSDDLKKNMMQLSIGKWSELAKGVVLQNPSWSIDSKFVYFSELGADGPEIDRTSLATRKKERVAMLKGILQVSIPGTGTPWNGVAPDGSLLIMRDVGIRELYALDLQLP